MTHPLITVLMTAYNRERYIAAAIESVLQQTYANFELIIVDDRSTDGTGEVAQEYARHDRRVRVVVNDVNLGDYRNRNHAARLACGSFLKYHDSDDVMYPHCLATMVAPLAAEPSAGFALSNAGYWIGGPCPMLLTPRLCYQREFLGQGLFMCGPSGALFRTAAFHELGGFPERGAGSDYLFWLAACARVNVVLVPGDLFWYRVHAEQEIRDERAAWDYLAIVPECWRALGAPTCPLTPDERERAKRNVVATLIKLTCRDLRQHRWQLARHRLRSLALSPVEWLRYLRPPRRDPFAGTPRDAQGEFVTPDWSHFETPTTPEIEKRA